MSENNLKVRYSDIFVKFVIVCGSGQIKGVDMGRGYVTHGSRQNYPRAKLSPRT
jgi:hypothetical protein